eukprot:4409850-Pleurochrysis_carterae.AAC.1
MASQLCVNAACSQRKLEQQRKLDGPGTLVVEQPLMSARAALACTRDGSSSKCARTRSGLVRHRVRRWRAP